MSKGNQIVVASPPRGIFEEGIIEGALKPGTLMQMKAGVAPDGTGRFTWQRYQRGTDGERSAIVVLREDDLQGKTMSQAYVDGDRCFLYYPMMGETINVLVDDIAGTADDVAIGDRFIIDTETGRLIATTGSVESEPFESLEVVTDPTADHLVWCRYTGY